uniref:Uncharacterized protein n=1 Tax=Nothobranchius kuhntae TaxID=321403 RepID=A0A1A8ISR0_NOTKU
MMLNSGLESPPSAAPTSEAHPQAMAQAPGSTQTQLVLVHPLSAKRKEDILKGIMHYIAQDMRPVNTVEGKGFKEVFKIVEPRYTVPARDAAFVV